MLIDEVIETGTELQGQLNYRSHLKFKADLKEGDLILISSKHLPYELDNLFPTSLYYRVIKKYENVVQLEHIAKNWKDTVTFTHSPSYLQLWHLIKHRKAKLFKQGE